MALVYYCMLARFPPYTDVPDGTGNIKNGMPPTTDPSWHPGFLEVGTQFAAPGGGRLGPGAWGDSQGGRRGTTRGGVSFFRPLDRHRGAGRLSAFGCPVFGTWVWVGAGGVTSLWQWATFEASLSIPEVSIYSSVAREPDGRDL